MSSCGPRRIGGERAGLDRRLVEGGGAGCEVARVERGDLGDLGERLRRPRNFLGEVDSRPGPRAVGGSRWGRMRCSRGRRSR